jgi:hypothetical protein
MEMKINISEELKTRLEEKTKETEFDSLEEYVGYILKQVISDEGASETEQAYTDDEEEAMKERLKDLGYV